MRVPRAWRAAALALFVAALGFAYARPVSVLETAGEVVLWLSGVRSSHVQAGPHRLRYLETGGGPPLILVHGLGSNAMQEWGRLMAPLGQKYHVYAPDLPGFGRSERPAAADYGIPQLRKRLIIYAVRGATPPQFPKPTHSGWTETSRRVDATRFPYVTSRDVIGELEGRDDLFEPEEIIGGRYGHLLQAIPSGDNYLFFTEKRGHPEPLFRWRSRYWTFLLKLDPDRPSTTIQSQPGPYVGPFHWANRRLRVPEVKRLQTFPDDYTVIGSRRSAQVQLGNAVPPRLAEIVARPLAEMLLGRTVPEVASEVPVQLVLATA